MSQRLPSLRGRMMRRVLWPLGLTWLLGSAVALAIAWVYTQQAFDRSLLDDAWALEANVSAQGGQLAFNLSAREVGAVLFDQTERQYFAVVDEAGALVAGQPGLRPDLPDGGEPVAFRERAYRGAELRVVTLWRQTPLPHAVVVAATQRDRSRLAARLLAASVAPQVLLLLALGWWLRRGITRELQPLAALGQALAERDVRDLAPLALTPATRDIARLGDAFDALMARIAAGVQAQREFAGDVAHELRTPLAGIRSLAEYGLAHPEPTVREAQLRQIVASEQRASHLVDQLLALALASESGQSLQLVPVRLDELVREHLLRLLPRADAQGVDLGAEGLDRAMPVLGTPALLEGVLVNLTDNALRHGRPGQQDQQPRITVALAEEDEAVLLSVSDNGPGLDEPARARVLGRWQKGLAGPAAGTAERAGSIGLGLAIVDRYVALLGGRLSLEAAPGGTGLCACVRLRRAP